LSYSRCSRGVPGCFIFRIQPAGFELIHASEQGGEALGRRRPILFAHAQRRAIRYRQHVDTGALR